MVLPNSGYDDYDDRYDDRYDDYDESTQLVGAEDRTRSVMRPRPTAPPPSNRSRKPLVFAGVPGPTSGRSLVSDQFRGVRHLCP
jgi:hypothetical protein